MENKTVYEVSYLLLPVISGEEVPKAVAKIKDTITSRGGEVIADENPVLIDLAYPMTKVIGTTRHKADSGYFGWVKFEMPADVMAEIKKVLDGAGSILRYLIVKTVRESTLLHGKMMFKKEEKSRGPQAEEPEEIIAEKEAEKETLPEDLDKSIDDLVIV